MASTSRYLQYSQRANSAAALIQCTCGEQMRLLWCLEIEERHTTLCSSIRVSNRPLATALASFQLFVALASFLQVSSFSSLILLFTTACPVPLSTQTHFSMSFEYRAGRAVAGAVTFHLDTSVIGPSARLRHYHLWLRADEEGPRHGRVCRQLSGFSPL